MLFIMPDCSVHWLNMSKIWVGVNTVIYCCELSVQDEILEFTDKSYVSNFT